MQKAEGIFPSAFLFYESYTYPVPRNPTGENKQRRREYDRNGKR
jgi:hypothetical protein